MLLQETKVAYPPVQLMTRAEGVQYGFRSLRHSHLVWKAGFRVRKAIKKPFFPSRTKDKPSARLF